MGCNLERLSEDWKDIKSVVLYGAGINAAVIGNVFNRLEMDIPYVLDIDKEKRGRMWNGIPIASYDEVGDKIQGKKIVIMTAHTAYNQISDFLNQKGLRENVDYCGAGQFLCEWFWKAKGMNCIYHVDMTVTTRCTFHCKHCNMFIPYYKVQENYGLDDLKRNLELFFERIDFVAYFGLIGGETLLCPVIPQLLQYMDENYHGKYGRVSFTTNGSVIPSDEVLHALKKYNVYLTISDYTSQIPYREKFLKLIDKLQRTGVDYEVKHALEWCDFGFPDRPYHYNESQLQRHLECCTPEWNGLNEGRFYYCNVAWSAGKSGLFDLERSDYINLTDINPQDKQACHTIVELSRGTSSFCKICGGCGSDNKNYVPIGEQM